MLRTTTTMVWVLISLLLASCGGGGAEVSSSKSSLAFTVVAGDAVSQTISVTLEQADGTVYAGASSSNSSVVNASFSPTGDKTGTITVTSASTASPGTYNTEVRLTICADNRCSSVLNTYNYPVAVTVLPGLTVTPNPVSMAAVEGASQQLDLAVVTAPGTSGTVSASVFASYPDTGSWLQTQVVSNGTVRLTASATGLSAAVRQATVLVSYRRTAGGQSVVNVPVTFTVGQGLVAPAAQVKTWDANATPGSLAASVQVARADAKATPWSATSSASWLVLAPASGTTPSALGYSIDATAAASLPNFKDHTATVTISASGIASVNFQVMLRKQLPYVAAVMPYGIAAGTNSRVVVGGAGFTQYANMAASLSTDGLAASSVQVVSDTQLMLNITPPAAGDYVFSLPNASSAVTPRGTLKVAAPDPYVASTAAHSGEKDISVHDPVRQAVYSLARSSALYRYQYASGAWTVTASALSTGVDMTLAPDGRLLVTTSDLTIKEIDPVTLQVRATYPTGLPFDANAGTPLAVSADGRLWLPGTLRYFDLTSYAAFGTVQNMPSALEAGYFYSSANGAVVLVSPSYRYSPASPWGRYSQDTASFAVMPSNISLFYRPGVSTDGSLVMEQYSGKLYDSASNLLGQLPRLPTNETYSLLALTPDGNRIVALVTTYFSAGSSVVTGHRIDIFSTTSFASGSTDFTRATTLPVGTMPASCPPSGTSPCNSFGRLLISLDNKTLFWVGNQQLQAIKLP